MSVAKQSAGTVLRLTRRSTCPSQIRVFSASASAKDDGLAQEPTRSTLEPHLVHTPKLERRLLRTQKATPVASRRQRAALQTSAQVPFEQLPYQCFQEARKILGNDRLEKIKQIDTQRARIERLRATAVEPQGEWQKERRIASMTKHLEELKIWADINDPVVKKRFEDGMGDMNKPIYRHLADKEWRSYKRLLLMQRVTQMNLIPDVLPTVDPVAAVDLAFGRRSVQPGEFVDSRVSEIAPRLNIQVFDKGERLVTIAVVNPDVPNVERDSFDYRCHFLACNIKISPTQTSVSLQSLETDMQVILPWLPAYVQKGAPYNRMSIFVFQQQEEQTLDVAALRQRYQRDGFILRSFADSQALRPVGAHLFRGVWDEGTAGVMQRLGIPGHDVEFKRKKVEPLPYKKLPGSRYR